MTTMMEHPKHGRHPATGDEIERLKAAGWTVRAPKAEFSPVTQEHASMAARDGVGQTSDTRCIEDEVIATVQADQPRTKRAYTRKA